MRHKGINTVLINANTLIPNDNAFSIMRFIRQTPDNLLMLTNGAPYAHAVAGPMRALVNWGPRPRWRWSTRTPLSPMELVRFPNIPPISRIGRHIWVKMGLKCGLTRCFNYFEANKCQKRLNGTSGFGVRIAGLTTMVCAVVILLGVVCGLLSGVIGFVVSSVILTMWI